MHITIQLILYRKVFNLIHTCVMRKLDFKNVLSVLVFVFTFTFSGNATGTGNVRMYPIEGSKKAKVFITLPQSSGASITIKSMDGTLNFYSEEVPVNDPYAKVYDFSRLEDGIYKLVTETKHLLIEKTFEISKSNIRLVNESVRYLPIFIEKEARLMINYFNEQQQPLAIKFSDGKETFFEEKIDPTLNLSRVYNYSGLPKGTYTVYMDSGKEIFSYELKVK